MDRYYLAVDIDDPLWQEVSKEQFVQAERAAGFRNTMGQPDEPDRQVVNMKKGHED